MELVASARENDDVDPLPDPAERDFSHLAIIEAIVDRDERRFEFEGLGFCEIHPMLGLIGLALLLVPRKHNYCTPNNYMPQERAHNALRAGRNRPYTMRL